MAPITPSPFRVAEQTALKSGSISKAEIADLAKAAKSAGANEVNDVLSSDNFEPGARADLVAALKAQHIAVTAPPSQFQGVKLGTDASNTEVRVKREVGAHGGYDQKLQAIAVARLAGVDPAAVVQDAKGKWHAVETTSSLEGGKSSGPMPATGLTPKAKMAAIQAQIATMNPRIDELTKKIARTTTPADEKKAATEELNGLLSQRGKLREEIAPMVFGVPASQINFNQRATDREAETKDGANTMINVSSKLEADHGARGKHGAEKKDSPDFSPTKKTAIEINRSELDNPGGAQDVLFHEMTHKNDYELAQNLVKQFDPKGTVFIPVNMQRGLKSINDEPFHKFLDGQVKSGKISKADAETAWHVAQGDGSETEARAHLGATLAAVTAGATDVAVDQLTTYARENHSGGKAGVLNQGSEVQKDLTKQIQDAYKNGTPEQRDALKKAIAAAKAESPKSWVSQIKLG